MAIILGLDIGGANTKAALIETKDGRIASIKTGTKYFPVWRKHEKLETMLSELKGEVAGSSRIDCIGITMTAELSDSYKTKREGVKDVLAKVAQAFPSKEIFVLSVEAKLLHLKQAQNEPLQVAAANWAATGWMVSNLIEDGIVIDVGSTTTSIIPILNGSIAAEGRNDLEKLINGELAYTGSLRTNVAAIVNSIRIRRKWATVSSELFAQSGDVHLILGNVSEEEYTVETVDGKGKSRDEALARLARVVCADTEMLSEDEIIQIAEYVYDRQVEQVTKSLCKVCNRNRKLKLKETAIVVTGLGREFLAKKAACQIGFDNIQDLEELTNHKIAKVSTAVGVALMTASRIEGKTVKWTQ